MTRTRSYELHEGAHGLADLRPEWEALEAAGINHIFQTWAHADLWQRTVGEASGAKPLLVALREDGRLVGIFPACRVRESGLPLLTWLGAPRALDYGDVIFDPAAAETPLDEFVHESLRLLSRAAGMAFLYLPNVRDDARAFAALSGRMRVLRHSSAPFIPIVGTWEAYLATRGRDLRHELKRRTKRLDEEGINAFALLEPGDPGVAEAVEALGGFQRSRFDVIGARSSLFDEHFARFRELQATTDPHSRIATLRFEGRIIAVSLDAVFRGRLYSVAPGFDNSFARFSPGALLKAFVIRSCYENGWDPCDFGWGDEAYKYRWTSQEVRLTTFAGADAAGSVLAAGMGARRHFIDALARRRSRVPRGGS
jgi:CelD/BcsL family acetyltransferase involved in cellulose biosynthesis